MNRDFNNTAPAKQLDKTIVSSSVNCGQTLDHSSVQVTSPPRSGEGEEKGGKIKKPIKHLLSTIFRGAANFAIKFSRSFVTFLGVALVITAVVVLAVAGVLTLGPGWIAVIIALLSLLVVSIIMDARSDVEEFDLKMDSYRLEPNHANDELKYFHFPSNGNNSASKAGTAVNGGDNSDTKEGFIQEPYLPGAANKNEGDKNLSTSAPEPSTLI